MTAPGASRLDPLHPALAASGDTRFASIPDFDSSGEYHFTGKDGVLHVYSQNYPACAWCGGHLPKVVVWCIEARATYHDIAEGIVIGSGMGCPECAAILVPTPLFIKIAGWRAVLGEGRLCCTVARIRKYADALWAKDETHLSDKWEAWAARLSINSAVTVPRDHDPDTCQEHRVPPA